MGAFGDSASTFGDVYRCGVGQMLDWGYSITSTRCPWSMTICRERAPVRSTSIPGRGRTHPEETIYMCRMKVTVISIGGSSSIVWQNLQAQIYTICKDKSVSTHQNRRNGYRLRSRKLTARFSKHPTPQPSA